MKKMIIGLFLLLLLFLLGIWWTDKNNPYSSNTWVKPFFTTAVTKDNQIILTKNRDLHVWQIPFSQLILYAGAIFRIEGNLHNPERPFSGNEKQIIEQIHAERFNPSVAYTTTGGHFAELYMRNFGVFYNAMLDERIPTGKDDWLTRQKITLQIIATDLELVKQAGKAYTTFIPINSNTFVGTNFNTEPSDSLFALVYTLRTLSDETFIPKTLPTTIKTTAYPLQTKHAAKKLLEIYKSALQTEISKYLSDSIDPLTGLIRKEITLSSARDGIKRQSSFYDNIIAWSTANNATALGIPVSCPQLYQEKTICNFAKWKQKIIAAFWDEKEGIFINDLSQKSITNHTFTGEAFFVLPSGFFDLHTVDDKEKLFRMITYVKKNNLDKPFPLLYARTDEPDTLSFFVRYFAPSYMGRSIWSHLGQDYIQSLILLSPEHPQLLQDAKTSVAHYQKNIKKYGGYPELYDEQGNIFMTPFYKSVLHTGWVIKYEQTKMLLLSGA